MFDKVEVLFKHPEDTKKEKESFEQSLRDFLSTASKMDKKELAETFDSVEKAMIETMTSRGIPSDKANELAKKVRVAAENIIKSDA